MGVVWSPVVRGGVPSAIEPRVPRRIASGPVISHQGGIPPDVPFPPGIARRRSDGLSRDRLAASEADRSGADREPSMGYRAESLVNHLVAASLLVCGAESGDEATHDTPFV